ncbi:MAG: outer membrane lipoprotein carrier protein LolA, partial [Candidatus Sulfotelmatobacter sp.]
MLSQLALSVAGLAVGPTADVKTLAAAVDAHYNHLRSLQAEFTEIYRGSGMERTESGTLWLKKPGKMRWEYRSPREKLFISDGRDAWFYVPDDRQARKTAAKKLEDVRSPLAFLLGKAKLERELQALSLAPDVEPLTPGNVVLRGVPQALADRVSEIVLEITPDHQIVRIVIQEVDG